MLYPQALSAARNGDKRKTESLLDELVAQQPDDEEGWLLLSQVASSPKKVEQCLRQVLAIDPDHIEASRRLSNMAERKARKRSEDELEQRDWGDAPTPKADYNK